MTEQQNDPNVLLRRQAQELRNRTEIIQHLATGMKDAESQAQYYFQIIQQKEVIIKGLQEKLTQYEKVLPTSPAVVPSSD